MGRRVVPVDACLEEWPLGPPPPGFVNTGNTCYANAALQCMLSTALSQALLDPKAVIIFRRYSSNLNLLQQHASREGEDSEEEDDLTGQGEERQRRKALADQRHLQKEREQKAMHELSQWLTRELTRIARQYTDDDNNNGQAAAPGGSLSVSSASTTSGGLFSFLGSQSAPGPQRPIVDPGSITRHVDKLAKTLRPYQQEDAHEFLRALLGTLCMNGQNKQLSSLFDGLLESAVTCQCCRNASLTRDRYMDLSLDISHPHIHSLDDALKEFTKTEVLQGDNKVWCEKCEKKRAVTKGLRLATAPSILVCHLKRFAFDAYGRMNRLSKAVSFPMRLDIGDCMSRANRSTPPPYGLVGALVHQGHSCEAGHYLAYVKSNHKWYKANDSHVTPVDVDTVLKQKAYLLVYEVAEMRQKHGYEAPAPPERVLSRDRTSDTRTTRRSVQSEGVLSMASSSSRRPEPNAEPRWEQQPDSANNGFSSSIFGLLNFCATTTTAEGMHDVFLNDFCCGFGKGVDLPGDEDLVATSVSEDDSDDDSVDLPQNFREGSSKTIRMRVPQHNNEAFHSNPELPTTSGYQGTSSKMKRRVSLGNLQETEREAASAYRGTILSSSRDTSENCFSTHVSRTSPQNSCSHVLRGPSPPRHGSYNSEKKRGSRSRSTSKLEGRRETSKRRGSLPPLGR